MFDEPHLMHFTSQDGLGTVMSCLWLFSFLHRASFTLLLTATRAGGWFAKRKCFKELKSPGVTPVAIIDLMLSSTHLSYHCSLRQALHSNRNELDMFMNSDIYICAHKVEKNCLASCVCHFSAILSNHTKHSSNSLATIQDSLAIP